MKKTNETKTPDFELNKWYMMRISKLNLITEPQEGVYQTGSRAGQKYIIGPHWEAKLNAVQGNAPAVISFPIGKLASFAAAINKRTGYDIGNKIVPFAPKEDLDDSILLEKSPDPEKLDALMANIKKLKTEYLDKYPVKLLYGRSEYTDPVTNETYLSAPKFLYWIPEDFRKATPKWSF